MNKLLLGFIISALSGSVFAADEYTIDSRHTFPSFEISHMGFSIQRGRFNQTEGKIVLDMNSVSGGSVQATINSASISTGLAELENHLRGEDFLNSAKYPQISFTSSKLWFANQQLTAVDGTLSLHGVTKPVHLTVDHFHCGINMINLKNVCGANLTTTIKRADFGVDKYVPMISDEVKIIIQVEAIKN